MKTHRSLRSALLSLLLSLLVPLLSLTPRSGAEAQTLAAPTIRDSSDPWLRRTARHLQATVQAPAMFEIVRVYVRYARHFWPEPATAHLAEARAVAGQPGLYRAIPEQAVAALRADHLFYEWFVDYRLRGRPSGVLTAQSGRGDFVVDCTQRQQDETLRALAIQTRAFATRDPHHELLTRGYPIYPHLDSSLAGFGLTVSGVNVLFPDPRQTFTDSVPDNSFEALTIGPPDLLFFAPRVRRADEPRADYLRDLVHPARRNGPYRLIGAAWTTKHLSTTRRPTLGCVPSSAWFLHEAGFHLKSGKMALRGPGERVRGSARVLAAEAPGGYSNPVPQNVFKWHPRFWDLHLWLPEAIGGTRRDLPTLAIYAPSNPPPGASVCDQTPARLLPCASHVFFQPETFE